MVTTLLRIHLPGVAAGLLALTIAATAADPPPVLHPVHDRKAAPAFALQDASGKTLKLDDFHGKVVLLDFWATWCTGCKTEIPWFTEFQKSYGANGYATVGVSMDEEGWKVLRPFLDEHKIPYPMLLGDESMAKQYGVETLPDTFLIDRHGRVAAAYLARLVDRGDIEAKIKALLAEH
jgi:cytochrome c biogenesis protein CcmG/thiol:disulfide interchange protein DsbE